MAALRWAMIILGFVLLVFGGTFALQGANLIAGSSLMRGNPTFLYGGGVSAIVGLILLVAAAVSKK